MTYKVSTYRGTGFRGSGEDMKFRLDIKRIVICFLAVLGMGFFLSFLMLCGLGTDPCSFMNKAISLRIGMLFGTWQLIINAVMLVIVLFWDRSSLGFGTVFNMVLVGYYVDFFDWVWGKIIPAHYFTDPVTGWAIFLAALFFFIVSAAVYINSDMGVAPYDALPKIITEKVTGRFPKVPKMLIRMAWDFTAVAVGTLAGGRPVIGIILMAVFLGPVISLTGRLFFRKKAE